MANGVEVSSDSATPSYKCRNKRGDKSLGHLAATRCSNKFHCVIRAGDFYRKFCRRDGFVVAATSRPKLNWFDAAHITSHLTVRAKQFVARTCYSDLLPRVFRL